MALFGPDSAAARLRYRHFMGEPVDEDRLMQLRTGASNADTDNEPKTRTREDTIDIDLETLIRRVADEMDVTEDMISGPGRSRKTSHARAMIAILAMDHTAHTLYEVAARLNRDVSTLSKQVAHLRDRRQKFDRLDTQIKQLVKIIK
jgi:chromosomal replication initiation ATPase DnaA